MLSQESLTQALGGGLSSHPMNRLPDGSRVYDDPLVGIARADDPYFAEFKKPEVIGPFYRTPGEWLPGARTVISYFLPFSEAVRKSNYPEGAPSVDWLHARFKGETVNNDMKRFLVRLIENEGCRAVAPTLDQGFVQTKDFKSNWSERHAAFVAGLGTFGLSRGLITKRGMAGRFGSIVTDLDLAATERDYAGPFDYCMTLSGKADCGVCAGRCPAHAISAKGKENPPCSDYLRVTDPLKEIRTSFGYPYSACGKCQTRVPCEHGLPGRASQA